MDLHPQQPAQDLSSRSPRRWPGTRVARRLAWIAGYAALRGAATTAGGAAVTALIWWIHNR